MTTQMIASLYFRLRPSELAILVQHEHILKTPTIRGSKRHYQRLLKLCSELKVFSPRQQDALAKGLSHYLPEVEKLPLLNFYNDSYNMVVVKPIRRAA